MFSETNTKNIALIGFSATGKSTIAKKIAEYLGWDSVDTDQEIVKLSGIPISKIFEKQGEDVFRQLEVEVLNKACLRREGVISTGGGAVLNPQNAKILSETCFVVCLQAKAETIYDRLLKDSLYSSNPVVRPLLCGENPLEKIKEIKRFREPYYSIADWTVHTDKLSVDQVTEEVLKGWKYLNDSNKVHELEEDSDIKGVVKTASRTYPLYIDWGLMNKLGVKLRQSGCSGKAVIISDETVFSIYGNKAINALEENSFPECHFVISPGESSKNIYEAIKIYNFLINQHIERGDTILALGGGVIGDLAGFVASTYLRGISWIQVPTTLVGMVDASIGGKVAVDHPLGKNLIGAFYQPSLVLSDVSTLTSLPERELNSGWAEVIKYGLIQDRTFFELVESNVENLLSLVPDITKKVVAQSASIKAQIVNEDERDKGKRIILNYGHTVGHAIEVVGNYKAFLHGEAVAVGMVVAARLSQHLGLLTRESVRRLETLLERFHLPVNCTGIKLDDLLSAMALDKKIRNKMIQWVLLEEPGRAIVRTNIPDDLVLKSIREVVKP